MSTGRFLYLAGTNLPGQWTWTENLIYPLIIVGTVLVTLSALWIFKRFRGEHYEFELGQTRPAAIKLVFEETLSAAERAAVRDQQVREAVQYLPKDPNLEEPLNLWREKRREWAAQVAFLESLGSEPVEQIIRDQETAEHLRFVHHLVMELESSQRSMLRAVHQSLSTGGNRPHLGTAGTN